MTRQAAHKGLTSAAPPDQARIRLAVGEEEEKVRAEAMGQERALEPGSATEQGSVRARAPHRKSERHEPR